MDPNVERRIRDRAYQIWEQEGRPPGRDVEHWLRAAEQIAEEEGLEGASAASAADTPEPTGAAGAEKPKRARAPRAAASAAPASTRGRRTKKE